jgi:hypothetical protein
MPLDPKAITPRDVRASGVLKFVETAEGTPGGGSQVRVQEVSSIRAEKDREMKAKAEEARQKRERKRQERQWCASPRREHQGDGGDAGPDSAAS